MTKNFPKKWLSDPNKKTKNVSEKDDGLPEVAHEKSKPRALLVIGGVLLVIGLLSLLSHVFSRPSGAKSNANLEENYTINQAPLPQADTAPRPIPTVAEKPQPKRELTEQQMAFIQEREKAFLQRLQAPLMIVNNPTMPVAMNKPAATSGATHDANLQFMDQVSSQPTDRVTATTLTPFNALIAQGGFIHAILESAMNSDLPGMLRAIVAEDVYSEDGSQVLIPRGSRLIGQYKSGMLQGQSRVFVVWTRVITPQGISLNLGSPGVDNLGMAGMGADAIERHFWQQFGTAILLSMIGAGAANVGVSASDQFNAAQAYRTALSTSLNQTAHQSLQQTGAIPPTLTLNQGTPIMVFVAHDLTFQNVLPQAKASLYVF